MSSMFFLITCNSGSRSSSRFLLQAISALASSTMLSKRLLMSCSATLLRWMSESAAKILNAEPLRRIFVPGPKFGPLMLVLASLHLQQRQQPQHLDVDEQLQSVAVCSDAHANVAQTDSYEDAPGWDQTKLGFEDLQSPFPEQLQGTLVWDLPDSASGAGNPVWPRDAKSWSRLQLPSLRSLTVFLAPSRVGRESPLSVNSISKVLSPDMKRES